jgi:hypothetical protein
MELKLQTCTVITPGMRISKTGKKFYNPVSKAWESIACKIQLSDDFEHVMSGESFGIILH